jgi:hypothetical protein
MLWAESILGNQCFLRVFCAMITLLDPGGYKMDHSWAFSVNGSRVELMTGTKVRVMELGQMKRLWHCGWPRKAMWSYDY